jgi:hypothetical protein
MKTRALFLRLLACAIVLFALGISVYRARTQPIAHDEAMEYRIYLEGGVYSVLFYGGNHVLFTLLAKPVVWVLGVSEFNLRIPSLIGTAIYLLFTYLLSRELFGEGILFLISIALLSLNPQVMDFMVAARGYILGLACLAAAVYAMTRATNRQAFDPENKEWQWGCAAGSIFLSLSVVATLSNVFAAGALTISFAAMVLLEPGSLRWRDAHAFKAFARYFAAPGTSVGFCFMWPYAIQFRLSPLNIVLHHAADTLSDIFASSFLYKWTSDIYAPSLGAVAPAPSSWQSRMLELGVYGFLPLVFCFAALGLIVAWRRFPEGQKGRAAHARLVCGAAILSVVLILLAHVFGGMNYPVSRYCLYAVPLFTLGSLLAAEVVAQSFSRRWVKGTALLFASVILFDYMLCLQNTFFRYNAYDVISRDVFLTISRDAHARRMDRARVGGSWWYEPEMNFYRKRAHADWLLPYDVVDASYGWKDPNAMPPGDYDYFFFTAVNDPGLKSPRARIIYHDDQTHLTIIAIAHD